MIAPHRPSFGIVRAIAASIASAELGIPRLEQAYCEFAGSAAAVWLPSARAGIYWALQAGMETKGKIIAPAFTCSALRETLEGWPDELQLLDASSKGFLMDPAAIHAAQTADHALVLCEAFGHTYNLDELGRNSPVTPAIRIVDMAMAVPHPELFQRLKGNDFAVISFGIGKSMYSGWGAIGLSQNDNLVNEVRKLRDGNQGELTSALYFKRTAGITLRTLSHYPWLYRISRAMEQRRQAKAGFSSSAEQTSPELKTKPTSPLWSLPSIRTDQALSLWNLRHARQFDTQRIALADRYASNLRADGRIICPPPSSRALSHFTIRLDSSIRDRVKYRLYDKGINATTLWQPWGIFDKSRFPNTFRLTTEVLNLPLSVQLCATDIDRICHILTEAVDAKIQS